MSEALRALQIGDDQRSGSRQEPARPRRRWPWVAGGGAAALAIALAAWFASRTGPVPVEVMIVTTGPSGGGALLTAGGYVRHARVVNVVPRVSGVIAHIRVKEGDVVQRGELLAALDGTELEQQVAEARADLRAAEARLLELRTGARPEELAEARARADALEASARSLERERDRSQLLADEGAASSQSLDQAQSELLVAQKAHQAARHAVALLEAGPRREVVAAARASADAARARAARAAELLGRTQLRAPMAGRVLRKYLDVGAVVSFGLPYAEGMSTLAPGSPVVSIGELAGLEATADLNEVELGRIEVDQVVEVRADAYPGEAHRARVLRISPRADRNKKTVEVVVRLDDPAPAKLLQDMSVKLSFQGGESGERRRDPEIPAGAVVARGGEQLVAVVEDGRVRLRPVVLGAPGRAGLVAVKRGLAEGDVVVISGPAELKDGARVVPARTSGGERP